MSVSRRSFLRSGAVGALSAGLIFKFSNFAFGQKSAWSNHALDFQIPLEAANDPVFYYTRAMFEPYVGTVFQVRPGRRTVNLKLVSAKDYQPRSTAVTTGKTRSTDCFSLLFRSSARLPDFSTIHRLEHPALGKFDLFMTGSEGGGKMFYTAVINHLG
jgi:hypothetical protein